MKHKNSIMLAEALLHQFLPTRKLTLHRLTSLAYLCDWKHLLDYNSQITDCNWLVKNNTIRSPEFINAMQNWDKISFDSQKPNQVIATNSSMDRSFKTGSSQAETIRHVFEALHTLSEFNIETAILSTYPFKFNGLLDLKKIAAEYKPTYENKYPRSNTA